MRSVRTRLEALEDKIPTDGDQVDTILVTFWRPGEQGAERCDPVAMRDNGTGWQIERGPGEELQAFHDRAKSSCPRSASGATVLVEVLK